MIDDVYIGATVNLRKRIKAHICCSLYKSMVKQYKIQKYIRDKILKGEKIKIKIIGTDIINEVKYISENSHLNLLNDFKKGRTYDKNIKIKDKQCMKAKQIQ